MSAGTLAPVTGESALTKEPRLVSKLDALMRERGITGKKLAEDANATERAVSVLRRNSFQLLDSNTVARVCLALKVKPGDLFDVES